MIIWHGGLGWISQSTNGHLMIIMRAREWWAVNWLLIIAILEYIEASMPFEFGYSYDFITLSWCPSLWYGQICWYDYVYIHFNEYVLLRTFPTLALFIGGPPLILLFVDEVLTSNAIDWFHDMSSFWSICLQYCLSSCACAISFLKDI